MSEHYCSSDGPWRYSFNEIPAMGEDIGVTKFVEFGSAGAILMKKFSGMDESLSLPQAKNFVCPPTVSDF